MFARRLVVLAAGVVLALPAVAGDDANRKTFKCKNEKGEIYYSDHFVPEHCKGGGSQLNADGIAVRQIERQLTPEERAAAKAKAERDAEEARIAEEKAHADRVLLQSYANEEELSRAHQKELTQVDTEMQAARASLSAQEKNLTELLNMAADAERAGQKVSAPVTKNIGIVRKQVESQKAFIQRKIAQKEDLERDFQVKLKRYRELIAAKAPAAPTAH